jgi:phosphatidylinositol-3-phosphatase
MRKLSHRRLVTFVLAASLGAVVSCAGVSHEHDAGKHAPVTTDAAKIKHVFLIVLENKNYTDTFDTSTQDPYLQKTLVPMGALLTQYYGTGHVSLDNYISMISGQSPTRETANDCLPGFTSAFGNYNDVVQTGITPEGQIIAQQGCIYSKLVKTLPEQLSAAGLTWRAYMEDMGNDPARESDTCGHPSIGIGTDNTNRAEARSAAVPLGDAYATRHNPFMYFHSIIDSPSCHTHVVNLSKLPADLEKESSTPNFVFITPNLCNDGHDGSGTGAVGTTCVNGDAGGLTSADAFLKEWVPRIMASRAYREDGLLIITFDESNYTQSVGRNPSTGQSTVTITFPGQSCCNQQPGPNLSGFRPGSTTMVNTPALVTSIVINGFGGDRIGALLLSPFINPGSTSEIAYNHYSLLRSLEDIFRLEGHLGYAADDGRIHYFLNTIGNDRNVFQHRF